MDFEAPVDGWYVFFGVAVASVAMGGIALGFPTTAPPDANQVANTIDRAAGSTLNATATYDHDANFFWTDGKQIALRNGGGTTHASIAFGSMTPAWRNDNLEKILYGSDPGTVFSGSGSPCETLEKKARKAREAIRKDLRKRDDDWFAASDEVRVRSIRCTYTKSGTTEEVHVTLVDV